MASDFTNDLCAGALAVAALGYPVLPVHGVFDQICMCQMGPDCDWPGKHPRLNSWPELATTDTETIRAWWGRWPDSNVGIATGTGSHIVVLDIDPEKGGDESLVALERELGRLPPTVEVLTGGGGRHLYFEYDGSDIRNSADLLGPGLDVRGDGGFVVAPPSTHSSGRRYEWEVSSHIEDVPMVDLPAELASTLRAPKERSKRNDPGWLGQALKGVPEGQRNHVAAKLAGYYLNVGLPPGEVAVILRSTFGPNCDPPH